MNPRTVALLLTAALASLAARPVTADGHYVRLGNLQIGSRAYADRDFVYSQVPATLLGVDHLATYNDDKFTRSDDFLRLGLEQASWVWVAYCTNYRSRPQWLYEQFADTGEELEIHDAASGTRVRFHLYRKSFPAGTAILGGNLPELESSNQAMYLVLLAPDTGLATGTVVTTAAPSALPDLISAIDTSTLEVEVAVPRIEVLDEEDGPGGAEPYLWAAFFKIDKAMLQPQVFCDAGRWMYTPGGEHKNLGGEFFSGDVIQVPAQFTWRTTLARGTTLFPDERTAKENTLLGAVLILQEEDDLPSTEALVNQYHPMFVSIVREQLKCAFLRGVEQVHHAMAASGHPFALPMGNVLQALRTQCDCNPQAGQATGDIGSASQPLTAAYTRLVESAESMLQSALKYRPWYVDLAPVNLDDYIGSKIFLWDFSDLEARPEQTFAIDMGDATGSDDGDFRLHVTLRSRYAQH